MTVRDFLHMLDQLPGLHAIGDLPLWAGILALVIVSMARAYLRGLAAGLREERRQKEGR